MIKVREFGKTKAGETVYAFTLGEGESSVTVLNYGGVVQSIVVPDRNGNPVDVALGHNDVAGYEENRGYLGALVGRFANRIEKGFLTVDGVNYRLDCGDRGNHLHGGKVGFDKKIWSHGIAGDALALTYISPDGEENYPGRLKVTVVYTFCGGALRIHYRATTDRTTAVNLTNHTYFNLGGENSGDVSEHTLQIESDEIVPTDDTMIPSGGYKKVAGTPFDFTSPKPIGRDLASDDEDLVRGKGYDHCFMLRNRCGEFVKYATAYCPATGISMECYTDLPAVQFYSGNGLHQNGKRGYYGPRAGFCLETQMVPNNVNMPEYRERGSSFLSPGDVYDFKSEYAFKA